MTDYVYKINKPDYRLDEETVEGETFTAGMSATFTVDKPALNQFVPDYLDRYVDGVLTNNDLVIPYTTTAQERAVLQAEAGTIVLADAPATLTPKALVAVNTTGDGLIATAVYKADGTKSILTTTELKVNSSTALATQEVIIPTVGTLTFTHGLLTGFTPV